MKRIITGKVRDVYELDESKLIIVTTDRISSFDVILGNEIPEKGVILNEISNFWFEYTKDIVPNHIISTSIKNTAELVGKDIDYYKNRTVIVKKLNMLPYEFIVRGYMFGSMWKAYSNGDLFSGHTITRHYKLAEKFKAPIMTPSKKIYEGHDEYISINQLVDDLGIKMVDEICDICLQLYKSCFEYAYSKGVIIADTKFEFGIDENGKLVLGDEIFTPDSSRFWNLEEYKVGSSPASYDKQFVRDWLIENDLNGKEPGPCLPKEIIEATRNLYIECRNKLLG